MLAIINWAVDEIADRVAVRLGQPQPIVIDEPAITRAVVAAHADDTFVTRVAEGVEKAQATPQFGQHVAAAVSDVQAGQGFAVRVADGVDVARTREPKPLALIGVILEVLLQIVAIGLGVLAGLWAAWQAAFYESHAHIERVFDKAMAEPQGSPERARALDVALDEIQSASGRAWWAWEASDGLLPILAGGVVGLFVLIGIKAVIASRGR